MSAGALAVTKDRALYRVDNHVVFLSEARTQIKELGKFRCLKKGWEGLKLTGLTKSDYPKYPLLPLNKKNLSEHKDFVLKYIRLQKIKNFAKFQLVRIDDNVLRKINKKNCFRDGYKSWSKEVMELVKLELYIKSRYLNNDGEKNEENLRSFLLTIDKKFSNILFF